MQISVVIPTYKREKYLNQVLADLSKQTLKDFEIVIVNQGNPTPAKGGQALVEYINIVKPSIVKAKNAGIKKARSDLILVLDDDLRVPKNLVEKHVKRHAGKQISAIAGPALEEDQFIIKRGGKSFGEFSIFGELNTDYCKVKKPTFVTAVPGGNLSFKKECWEIIGGYDENFKGNCINEDSDFCLRLSNRFGKILFDPDLKVTHLRAPGGSRAFGNTNSAQWYEDFFFNHLYFYRKHRSQYLLPLFFLYRMRQIYTCVLRYGKFKPAFLKAPFQGYLNALRV